MDDLSKLTPVQQNVLIASIIGDGEITKLYKKSRRKNHSYREHFGMEQAEYRKWKISFFDNLLYITPRSQCVRSSSLPLFTRLYPYFYHDDGSKHIPIPLLTYCTLPHFLAVLYMDDGSLCISPNINKRKKVIYLTPHIYLYLQNYPREELKKLQQHILSHFGVTFRLSKHPNGQGCILRTTSVRDTFHFLNIISSAISTCPSMYYKTNWNERLKIEKEKWQKIFPDFELRTSSHERSKRYSKKEIQQLKDMKQKGATIQEIADTLHRSYWSIVYKWREIQKE
ncbi:DNA endonuclease [Geobacillus sp. G4]|uniref:DNA endonuclease n=1 Tax=Geobacillus genomosp. 3 TaxID=1921421 RepID=S5Z328_GEOG3|nr:MULTISPECIES: DNA endonuclease [Geobacillus]ADI28068.1 LAGLIDADG DNA endonuclease [Geobacillus sp. C56-T3]AGT33464.1 DNA endonuclease [Geobacillus genomosp. 3]KPD00113.1 LAGLIDADG DNA endonuclease family protein [Geobacillus sp. BCO2]